MKIAGVTFTSQGKKIIEKLREHMEIYHYYKDKNSNFNIKTLGKKLMKEYEAIIFIGAAGIAVRTIAPFITTKDKDPAVLVIDNEGKFVISLLSGHLGGANELTLKVSNILKAQPVITTATDSFGIEAPDIIAKKNNYVIEDLSKAKNISALLVKGEKVGFLNDEAPSYLPSGYVRLNRNEKELKGLVHITNKKIHPKAVGLSKDITTLKLIKKNIILGIGCRKNYSSEKMLNYVEKILNEYNIDTTAIKLITTVEVKKNEEAILKLAETCNCPIKIWTIDDIKTVQHKFKGSDFVEKTLGIRSVCQPSVDLCGARILVDKIACDGMTLCIGEGE
ncbi:cobalt-precorrin 5A hydrolase [Clostridium bovifaecis]|uniref:Cobalt-precorrin 5A hydrolase n=1 Tax=Clostridium bovifaecis TaxID=2184719 RepID=A0A6I6EPV2_9CLOT|nr:cobalt-precorrin 5A hydrolase [Clostridium bovifaecis]